MKLFSSLTLKFEKSDWSRNPEFGLIDTLDEDEKKSLFKIIDGPASKKKMKDSLAKALAQ